MEIEIAIPSPLSTIYMSFISGNKLHTITLHFFLTVTSSSRIKLITAANHRRLPIPVVIHHLLVLSLSLSLFLFQYVIMFSFLFHIFFSFFICFISLSSCVILNFFFLWCSWSFIFFFATLLIDYLNTDPDTDTSVNLKKITWFSVIIRVDVRYNKWHWDTSNMRRVCVL